MGRINSRTKKKELKKIGIKGLHYAIYNNTIIASDKNRATLDKNLKALIKDKDHLNSIYYFKI